MESHPTLRLLPWTSPEGKPCFLANATEGGHLSRLADETEARQLAEGLEVLAEARKVLSNLLSPHVEVRYAAIRLSECLANALRVAESRGRRLLPQPDDTDDTDALDEADDTADHQKSSGTDGHAHVTRGE
ncbi:hypothetical protein [Streptomyces sp. F-3]|uniref:Uncharacterized protein n=1 Tax=Streptomyces thermogriseus TaxID=75292 RepID=A0ABN1SXS1_9ACTN|nr:hypothetical protein [Streptomyces sp. F-3]GAT82656.1 hypothetical protein [Streptomyces sp. F-3]